MSDETLSSRPPSFPIPTTIRSLSATALESATSARSVIVAQTSARSARPDRSRAITRSTTRLRNSRNARLSSPLAASAFVHFRAPERRRIDELFGEPRARLEHSAREARQLEFAKGFGHLKS